MGWFFVVVFLLNWLFWAVQRLQEDTHGLCGAQKHLQRVSSKWLVMISSSVTWGATRCSGSAKGSRSSQKFENHCYKQCQFKVQKGLVERAAGSFPTHIPLLKQLIYSHVAPDGILTLVETPIQSEWNDWLFQAGKIPAEKHFLG